MPAKKPAPRKAKDLKPKAARPSTATKVRGGAYMSDPGGVVSQPPPKKK
ncbi:MAG: hypothetical protein IPK12_17885 [Gemmatimonadetes bacterium]|nr:hypothetical protein [Gemmatimonadota bacterium]